MTATALPDDSQKADDFASHINPTPQDGPGSPVLLTLDQQQPFTLFVRWTATWNDAAWRPVDGLADGLNPITVPLSVAVEEIRRTIPLSLIDPPLAPTTDSVRREMRPHKPPVV